MKIKIKTDSKSRPEWVESDSFIEEIVPLIPPASASWGNISGNILEQSDLSNSFSGLVASNDSRLTDARDPLTHTHPYEPEGAVVAHALVHAPSNAAPNNISDVNAALLTGGQETTLHSHAGGPGGVSPLYIHLNIPILAALAWTNMPAALSFWLSTATVAKGVLRVDLTGYTQVRLLVNKQAVAGAAASKLILRYKITPFTQVVANYSDIGTTEVSVATNNQNTFLDSGWKTLVAGAKADIFLALLGSGGDGALDPAFGMVTAVFK